MRKAVLLTAVAVGGLWAGTAGAAILALPAFSGTTYEPFESFPNYSIPVPITYVTNGAPILYNAATISSPNSDLVIYQAAGANYGLGDFGLAPVSDGNQALGFGSANDTGVITFAQKVNAIGAYWGATKSVGLGYTPDITFTFFDGATPVGTAGLTYAGGGSLTWGGWFSTVPFDSFTFAGDYVVVDGIQSDAAPIPEPTSATAILLSVALLGTRRTRA